MTINTIKPLTRIALIGKGPIFEVEKSMTEIQEMITDESPFISIKTTDEKYHIIPKMAVKYFSSDCE